MSEGKDSLLIRKVTKIFEKSKFSDVASNVHFWVKGENTEFTEVDVCAIQNDTMFLVECKSGGLKNKQTELRRKHQLISAIRSKSIKKVECTNSKITPSRLGDVDDVFLGYCLGDKSTYNSHKSPLESEGILVWDSEAVAYFDVVSETLGSLTRNEIIYREFRVKDTCMRRRCMPAIKLKQGDLTLYLFTLTAYDLLRIAYVSRRGTRRDESYQRIINLDRLDSLSRFIKESKRLVMANPIILAFDPDVYGPVKYRDGKIEFTDTMCSAWVVDGQHRIFAFRDIDLGSRKCERFNIEIPVVALEGSNTETQSETFVNINYYQKKIDSLLIYDLAAHFKYPQNELVWPSLLTMRLNEAGTLKGLIKTKEIERKKPNERKKPLRMTNFVRTILDELLGYCSNTDKYDGPLFTLCKFNKNIKVTTAKNKIALDAHISILQSYFTAIKSLIKSDNDWRDAAESRGFLTSSAIKAFLLVLATILRHEQKSEIDFKEILKPIAEIDFTEGSYATYRAGYPAIKGYTKDILKAINLSAGKNYTYESISQRRKRLGRLDM